MNFVVARRVVLLAASLVSCLSLGCAEGESSPGVLASGAGEGEQAIRSEAWSFPEEGVAPKREGEGEGEGEGEARSGAGEAGSATAGPGEAGEASYGAPPSCLSGAEGAGQNCGASGDDDCCAVLEVPGGTFNRMNDPAYPATVSAFRMDKYPITVGRFRAFVEAGGGTQQQPPAPGSGANPYTHGRDTGWDPAWNAQLSGDTAALVAAMKCDIYGAWNTWSDAPGGREKKPIVCVTYYELRAFCAWDGGFLPTEAQFNHAAVGGSEQRPYPWGDDESGVPLRAAYDCIGDGSVAQNCKPGDITDVGMFPLGVGRWGHMDLSGIAYNTTIDSVDDYLPKVPCNDCVRYDNGTSTITWSGSWVAKLFKLKNDFRAGYAKDARRYYRSGRCARAL